MGRAKAPAVTVEAAERIARELFGVDGGVQPLPSYIDQNFLFDDAWILKIANDADDEGTLDLQNAAMAAVSSAHPGLAPSVRPSVAGNTIETIEHSGARHLVRMVSFLPGTVLANADALDGTFWEDLGSSLARVDLALADVRHPSMRRRLRWDLARAPWILPRLDTVADPDARALLERVCLQFEADVRRVIDRLPEALIYNDANDHNIVVEGSEGSWRVSGFFDFGDVVHTARVFEPAIAAAYAALGRDEPLRAMAAIARGYHRVSPLSDSEIRAFFPAACMRLAVSVIVAEQDARLEPENDYIRISQTPAWEALRRLASISPSEAAREIRDACELDSGAATPAVADGTARRLRDRFLSRSLSLSYREPLEIVRGRAQYLFDPEGRAYLDCVNNVCHVGHCHPHVVDAGSRQMAALNTNTRYLHEAVGRLAERITGLLPEHLQVCFFVNSGSEANELALRLARTATGRRDMLAIEHGYHGHSSALIDLSSYKHAGTGGQGAPGWVHVVPCPDPYRGRFRGPASGPRYAAEVEERLATLAGEGRAVAGIIAEPIVGCGGQIVPPDDYLRLVFEAVRAAGGVCIADEVQVGFGRVGTHWWAFEAQGATPDIVTLGKPIGNGHPLAAVVTTREIAEAFDNGMEFFATFGGNPVSSAIGLAVLDVIESEGLRENARDTGAFLLSELRSLAQRHEVIGDVRGLGFYLGVELVSDREARTPDARTLTAAIEGMKRAGLLLSTDGPDHNVLKFKPPMVFDRSNAELFLSSLDRALIEAG